MADWVCGRAATEHYDLADTRAALDAERERRRSLTDTPAPCRDGTHCLRVGCAVYLSTWREALIRRAVESAEPYGEEVSDDALIALWRGGHGELTLGARGRASLLARGLAAWAPDGSRLRLAPAGLRVAATPVGAQAVLF